MAFIGDIYRWFYGRLLHKPHNFSWLIPERIVGSVLLRTHNEFEWVIKQGIRCIVTIREIHLPQRYFEKSKTEKANENKNIVIDFHHIKVNDGDVPDLEVLIKPIDYIDQRIEQGRHVLIHCNGGRGRTGTLVTAYLMKKQRISGRSINRS